ncbi:MAG: hypothetical protein LW636_06025 [Planctomycetaceae bacterium]|nr:hypothetical protein [Planctomycetaceae bacterium]
MNRIGISVSAVVHVGVRLIRAVRVASASMLLALAVLGSTPQAAVGQGARELVPGALTTRRFERLLEGYVRPSDAEAGAIDRLHEQYLERFRLEIDPEIARLSSSMSGGMPSRQEFDRFMRELERLNARIAEADGAFLDACAGVVTEERRAGFQRIRESRERQRALSGFGQIGGMMFGTSIGFVDAVDLLLRPEFLRAVPAESRERLDAVLRAQEPRVLAQARAYAAELRDGMGKFFDAMSQSMGGEAPDPAAMQAFRDSIAVIGKDLRRLLRQNFERNREMSAQLASVLPERELLEFREMLALRSLGPLSATVMYGGEADVDVVASRIARDRAISPATKAEIDAIVLAWKRDWCAALDEAAGTLAADDTPSSMFGAIDGTDSPATRAVKTLTETRTRLANSALERIAAMLGERSGEFVARMEVFDGDQPDAKPSVVFQAVKAPDDDPDAAEIEASTARIDAFALGGMVEALTARDVLAVLSCVGAEGAEPSVVEALVEEWTTSSWNTTVAPIREELGKLNEARWVQSPEGRFEENPDARDRIAAKRTELALAALDADRKLIATVAGALGFDAAAPEPVLLRLVRMNMLMNRGAGVTDLGFPLPPAQLLRNAGVDAPTARAVAIAALPGLKEIADALPDLVSDSLERAQRIAEIESAFSSGDQARVQAASAEYMRLLQEGQREDSQFAERFAKIYDEACVAVVADEAQRAELRRSRLRSSYPSVYRTADSALREFAAAARLEGLTDDERARLEAMRAEYEGVYEMLSEQMILPAFDVVPGDGSPESWQEFSKRAEEAEKRRFQRSERTEKARNELRRMLGEERAALVPGLVRDEARRKERAKRNFNPFEQGDD